MVQTVRSEDSPDPLQLGIFSARIVTLRGFQGLLPDQKAQEYFHKTVHVFTGFSFRWIRCGVETNHT